MRVDAENFSREVLEAQVPVLADFYADSCLPMWKTALSAASIPPSRN